MAAVLSITEPFSEGWLAYPVKWMVTASGFPCFHTNYHAQSKTFLLQSQLRTLGYINTNMQVNNNFISNIKKYFNRFKSDDNFIFNTIKFRGKVKHKKALNDATKMNSIALDPTLMGSSGSDAQHYWVLLAAKPKNLGFCSRARFNIQKKN
jgi:hypothetical protein